MYARTGLSHQVLLSGGRELDAECPPDEESYRSPLDTVQGGHKRTVVVFFMAAAVLSLQVTLILSLFRPAKVYSGGALYPKGLEKGDGIGGGRDGHGWVVDDGSALSDEGDSDGESSSPAGRGGRQRQLWCVYEPVRGDYGLRDVPAQLCTVVVYCCVELTARGVQYRRVEDEGSEGVDSFAASLRSRRPDLPLYAFFGDGVQTTAVFCNQVRGSTPDMLTAAAKSWLLSKQLDGVLFFYRSHREPSNADGEFFAHFRRMREDLGRASLFVSAVVSFHRDQPSGPLSLSSVLEVVQDIVVLRTHDLSPLPVDAAACPMPFQLAGTTRAPSVSRLLADLNDTLPGFEETLAPRLLFSVTFEAASYLLNSSAAFQEGAPAVRMAAGSTYWQMCEMAAKLRYRRHVSAHGDCHVLHKDRFWLAGFGPESSRVFAATRRFAGVAAFAMHDDDARGRCGEPHALANHVRRSLDKFAAVTPPSGRAGAPSG